MKSLEEQLAFYAAYHRDSRNKATHFVGVPSIMLALFIPLSWLRVEVAGMSISAAVVLVAAVLGYYAFLDKALALAAALATIALLVAGQWIASLGPRIGWTCFGALFVGGWALQLLGHLFEGRK